MSTSLSGSANLRYNPDEPRDQHGRWTTGGSSWRNNPLRDPSAAGRAHTLLGHALASACHQGLIREFKLPTQGEAKRFSKALAAWNAASNLNDERFCDRFTHGLVDDLATVRRLRQAAAGSAKAQTFGQMVDASRPLTAAIKDIGAHRWTDVREELEERAEKTMPVQLAAEILASGRKQQTVQPKGPSANQPPAPEKGCEVGDKHIHRLIKNPALDGPEEADGMKAFHTPSNNSTTQEQRKRFYDCLYDKLEAMAKRLEIPVEWLLGLAAHESGWLDEHNWPLRNPFGLTAGGHNNFCFNTFRSVIDYWEKLYGQRVKGAKTVDEFLDALGKTKPEYNSKDPKWRGEVKKSINSQFLPQHLPSWKKGIGA